MRIVDRATFLALPAGTVFSKYEPCFFESIEIKHDTCEPNDFWAVDVSHGLDPFNMEDFAEKCEAMERGESVAMSWEDVTRDGLHNAGQLFAIWERADVEKFIARLGDTLK